MTRFARGGPANKKQVHDASSWSQLQGRHQQRQVPAKSNTSADADEVNCRHSDKRKKRLSKVLKYSHGSNSAEAKQNKQRHHKNSWPRPEPVSYDDDDDSDIIVMPLRKETESVGLAAELEHLKQVTPNLTAEEEKEISKVIKKDHRREERRLKRISHRQDSKICFKCRQVGHDMSSCPKATKSRSEEGTGICFKCGSTEHTIAKCRIKLPPGEFPYAKCFICGEQGHLSSKCPDNPRGLYPNGGCCKHCGSVEHFQRDCPELQKKQGIADMKLSRWSASHSVDDEVTGAAVSNTTPVKKRPKIVKF